MKKVIKGQKTVKLNDSVKVVKAITTTDGVKSAIEDVKASGNNDFNENIEKVTAVAQEVNSQIIEAAAGVFTNLKEVGSEIKEVATKTINDMGEKIDFTDSIEKVADTAKSVNKKIKETTTEVIANVVAEVKSKSREVKSTAANLAKDAIENMKVSDRVKTVRKAVANTNSYALEKSEELINSFETSGTQWQNVTEKAIKTGLKLAERQQNIVFSTLEAVKTQVGGTATRFKKLFSNN